MKTIDRIFGGRISQAIRKNPIVLGGVALSMLLAPLYSCGGGGGGGGTAKQPTCYDGVMNGNETGVDCGGSCGSCVVEPPVDPNQDNVDAPVYIGDQTNASGEVDIEYDIDKGVKKITIATSDEQTGEDLPNMDVEVLHKPDLNVYAAKDPRGEYFSFLFPVLNDGNATIMSEGTTGLFKKVATGALTDSTYSNVQTQATGDLVEIAMFNQLPNVILSDNDDIEEMVANAESRGYTHYSIDELKAKITPLSTGVIRGEDAKLYSFVSRDLESMYPKIPGLADVKYVMLSTGIDDLAAQDSILAGALIVEFDDDRDGIPNAFDSTPEPPVEPKKEICGNGIDDDGDGKIDEDCPVVPPVIPGLIVYQSRADGTDKIYTIKPNTREIAQITNFEANDPAWNGASSIVYSAYKNGQSDIWGSNGQISNDSERDLQPTGSKYGDVAWVKELYPDGKEIYLNGKRFTNTPGVDESYPALSYDGSEIAFVRGNNILIYDVNTKNQLDNIVMSFPITKPSFSPDGKNLSFNNSSQIFIYTRGTKKATPLTSGSDATWSPDGKKIAYRDTSYSDGNISIIDIDGINKQPLTSGVDYDVFPCWSFE